MSNSVGPKRKGRLVPQPGETVTVRWAFLNKYVDIVMLGDRVGYSWKCGLDGQHEHIIECLWVWHDCTMELDPIRAKSPNRTDDAVGWGPTGVAAHDLMQSNPLHIEASIYWPLCCGLHGWIRDGRYIDVND